MVDQRAEGKAGRAVLRVHLQLRLRGEAVEQPVVVARGDLRLFEDEVVEEVAVIVGCQQLGQRRMIQKQIADDGDDSASLEQVGVIPAGLVAFQSVDRPQQIFSLDRSLEVEDSASRATILSYQGFEFLQASTADVKRLEEGAN